MSDDPRNFAHVTARELLERVAGREHATHTIVSRKKAAKLTVELTCNCGHVFRAPVNAANLHAVRYVAEK